MSEVNSWSGTASSNNSAAPNGFPEGMAFADVNNAAREVMASVKRWRDDINGSLTAGGSSGAFTLTPNRTVSAYATGLEFVFKANHTSTSSPTLNVSLLGATSLTNAAGTACNLISGRYYRAVYIGSAFIVMDAFPDTSTVQEWTAGQRFASTNKTASSITIDCLSEPIVQWTMSANGTLGNFTNITKDSYGKLRIIQSGSGSYTVSVNANIKGTWPTLSTTVGAIDIIYWSSENGTNVSITGFSLNVAA